MKTCIKCKVSKEESSFHKNLKRGGLQSVCKPCRKQMDKVRYKTSNKKEGNEKRRKQLIAQINELKSSRGCSTCPESDYRCLDFHHIDPTTKENTISYLLRVRSLKSIMMEINKCIILCANCHRKLHATS